MDAPNLARLAVAVVFLGLGAWVAAINLRRRIHRAFALLMVVWAFTLVSVAFAERGNDAARLWAYGMIGLPFAIANFGLVFWRAYGARRPGPASLLWRAARWALLLACIGFEITYVSNHALWDDGWMGSTFNAAVPMTGTAVAVAMGAQFVRARRGQQRDALFLFTLGFVLEPAYFAASRVTGLLTGDSWPTDPFDVFVLSMAIAGVLCVVGLGFLAAWDAARRGDAHSRRQAMTLAAAACAALLSGALVGMIPDDVRGDWTTKLHADLMPILGQAWRLAFAALVCFAIVRYCLFTLDPRFKRLVQETGTAAVLAIAFFVTEQSLQGYVQQHVASTSWGNSLIVLGATGTVALLLFPVHRLCSRLADRAAPAGRDREAHERHRIEIYRAALNAALQDGFISLKERAALRRLADNLGLPPRKVTLVEQAAQTHDETVTATAPA